MLLFQPLPKSRLHADRQSDIRRDRRIGGASAVNRGGLLAYT